MKTIIFLFALFLCSNVFAQQNVVPISQLPNGGVLLPTDMIHISRCNSYGCDYRVIAAAQGNVVPGGTNGQFQYNNAGSFGGTTLISINGGTILFGGGITFTGRTVSTGTSDTASTSDIEVRINLPSAVSFSETIPACNMAKNNFYIIVTDEAGTASVITPITVTATSGTIKNSANFSLNTPTKSASFHCDGLSANYTVI